MNSETHFNQIAEEYDFWKKKNWYYYKNLVLLYKTFIPENSRVLEIGCGTGDVLSLLKPSKGFGIDISDEMIEIAKRKHGNEKNLLFEREDINEKSDIFDYDYIFLPDVMEHVHDLPRFISSLSKRTKKGSKIIISVANPIWEPVLMVAEKLKMKMPEGPHDRLSIKRNEEIFREMGLKITEKGYRLLIPKKLPLSDYINKKFYKIPGLSRLGFTIFWVLEKDEK